MNILGLAAMLEFIEGLGQGVLVTLAGCAAIGLAALAGRALSDSGRPTLQPIRVRARRR